MKTPTQTRRYLPNCEALEERALTTISSATLSAGLLSITADNANDNIEIHRVDPVIQRGGMVLGDFGAVPWSRIVVTDKTAATNNVRSFNASEVDRIYIELMGGDDRLLSTVGVPLTVLAGDGNDTVTTGAGADYIDGGNQNDLLIAGRGNDILLGSDGSDTLRGGSDDDNLYGGLGFNMMRGKGGDDRLYSDNRSDIVDGGPGYDYGQLIAKTVNSTVSLESLQIIVPQDQEQNDGWSCGPNSGSRLLRAHGINVSYSQLRSQVHEDTLLAKFHLGTRPSELRYAIGQHRALTTLETESSRERVFQLLRMGKPVIALIATTTQSILLGKFGWMHYVVLNGFDEATQSVNYVDTNGEAKSWSYEEFDYHWRWFDHFTGAGEAMQAFLYGLGLRKRTIIF
jgi:hypothetical protein